MRVVTITLADLQRHLRAERPGRRPVRARVRDDAPSRLPRRQASRGRRRLPRHARARPVPLARERRGPGHRQVGRRAERDAAPVARRLAAGGPAQPARQPHRLPAHGGADAARHPLLLQPQHRAAEPARRVPGPRACRRMARAASTPTRSAPTARPHSPGLFVNESGSLAAYAISRSGSDRQEIRVRDVETGKDLPDRILWAKFTSLAWLKDGVRLLLHALPGARHRAPRRGELRQPRPLPLAGPAAGRGRASSSRTRPTSRWCSTSISRSTIATW